MKADDVKRLKDLEVENTRLKRIVADKELENLALREIARGNWCPSRRRRAAHMLQQRLGLSQRRACHIVGQHRSTQRHEPRAVDPDRDLRAELRGFSRAHPRWGYRRAHAVLA